MPRASDAKALAESFESLAGPRLWHRPDPFATVKTDLKGGRVATPTTLAGQHLAGVVHLIGDSLAHTMWENGKPDIAKAFFRTILDEQITRQNRTPFAAAKAAYPDASVTLLERQSRQRDGTTTSYWVTFGGDAVRASHEIQVSDEAHRAHARAFGLAGSETFYITNGDVKADIVQALNASGHDVEVVRKKSHELELTERHPGSKDGRRTKMLVLAASGMKETQESRRASEGHAAQGRAIDLYAGPAFEVRQALAGTYGDHALPRTFILSRDHGLIPAHERVPQTDSPLTPDSADEIAASGFEKSKALRYFNPYSAKLDEIFVVAGPVYRRAFERHLSDAVAPDTKITFAEGTEAQKKAALADWLEANAAKSELSEAATTQMSLATVQAVQPSAGISPGPHPAAVQTAGPPSSPATSPAAPPRAEPWPPRAEPWEVGGSGPLRLVGDPAAFREALSDLKNDQIQDRITTTEMGVQRTREALRVMNAQIPEAAVARQFIREMTRALAIAQEVARDRGMVLIDRADRPVLPARADRATRQTEL
jgi:hypothetical protein